jgi:hypothetical protein
VNGGTRIHHVEEIDMGWGPLGWLHDVLARAWFARSVRQEVGEIARLLEAGERGAPPSGSLAYPHPGNRRRRVQGIEAGRHPSVVDWATAA